MCGIKPSWSNAGACTVHIDGEGVRKAVTTTEGLASDVSPSLQRAWLEEDVQSVATANRDD